MDLRGVGLFLKDESISSPRFILFLSPLLSSTGDLVKDLLDLELEADPRVLVVTVT